MVYLSNPGVISAGGFGIYENLSSILEAKTKLSKNHDYTDESFYLGKIHKTPHVFSNTVSNKFKTRTNLLLLNAVLQINEEINNAIAKYGKNRIGIVLGSTTTGIEENFIAYKNFVKNKVWNNEDFNCFKNSLCNSANFLSQFYELSSPNYAISTACTSGVKAIIDAKKLIDNNICDAVICGGVDSLNILTVNGFNALKVLSHDISNPFSVNRNGINIGEAAAVFLATKDKISNTFIAGCHSNTDAFHITKPDLSARMPIIAIEKSLKMADLSNVDYINLHGTGTIANDVMESFAISKTLPSCPASSIKPIIGHTLGAAGAIETAICFALMNQKEKSFLPKHPYDGFYDKSIERISIIEDKVETKKIMSTLSCSFAFGGDNAIIILRQDDEN